MKPIYFNLVLGIILILQSFFTTLPTFAAVILFILGVLNICLGLGLVEVIYDHFKNKDKNPF